MGKEGEGILVYYCIPQRDRVADVHAWPQGDLRTGDLRISLYTRTLCIPEQARPIEASEGSSQKLGEGGQGCWLAKRYDLRHTLASRLTQAGHATDPPCLREVFLKRILRIRP